MKVSLQANVCDGNIRARSLSELGQLHGTVPHACAHTHTHTHRHITWGKCRFVYIYGTTSTDNGVEVLGLLTPHHTPNRRQLNLLLHDSVIKRLRTKRQRQDDNDDGRPQQQPRCEPQEQDEDQTKSQGNQQTSVGEHIRTCYGTVNILYGPSVSFETVNILETFLRFTF